VSSSRFAATPAIALADVAAAVSRSNDRTVCSSRRRRSSTAAEAPASAVSPSTAIPLTVCARVDPVAPGNRSANDRRNECDAVPQPNAVDAATPAMIAWSRLARESRLG
jgi:hypothetical protein